MAEGVADDVGCCGLHEDLFPLERGGEQAAEEDLASSVAAWDPSVTDYRAMFIISPLILQFEGVELLSQEG